jgi:hypothetical protein
MGTSMKCRLRLHEWDDRVNPETKEHYEVCLRCDAYREKGRVSPAALPGGNAGPGGGAFGGFG